MTADQDKPPKNDAAASGPPKPVRVQFPRDATAAEIVAALRQLMGLPPEETPAEAPPQKGA